MKTKTEQLIDGLVEAAEAYDALTNEPRPYKVGDVVTFMADEQDFVGIIESESDDEYIVRVHAIAGNEFEPTDKLYTLIDSDMGKYERIKSVVPGDKVSWKSEAGDTYGVILSADVGKADIEVYAKSGETFEPTGVTVSHDIENIEFSEFQFTSKKHKILCKMEDVTMEYDESAGMAIIEGWASTYGNVDLGGDTIAKGAYTQTLNHKNGKVKMFADHQWDMGNLKGVAYLSDKDEGLWCKGMMPVGASDVKDTFIKIKFLIQAGEPIGFSIGYNPIKTTPNLDGTRTLNEIALEEVTITPYPMDTHAQILSARAKSIQYKSMEQKWATIKFDAPVNGNQNEQGDDELLAEFKSILTQRQKQ